ncbi:MAG TPA: flagellar export chaperone FliS [Bryobacteraceae bacterium]|nr:flagellar export chaperone FliS [Bryobacteraceae bacterium]
MQYYAQEYMKDAALTASPLELIRMLYEGGLSAIDRAIEKLQGGDIMGRGREITKAIEIVQELRSSLRPDVDPSLVNQLSDLYGYMQKRLLEAHAQQSESILREVSRLLRTLYEAWQGVMAQMQMQRTESSASVMVERAAARDEEAIPAGFLYGQELQGQYSGRSWQL